MKTFSMSDIHFTHCPIKHASWRDSLFLTSWWRVGIRGDVSAIVILFLVDELRISKHLGKNTDYTYRNHSSELGLCPFSKQLPHHMAEQKSRTANTMEHICIFLALFIISLVSWVSKREMFMISKQKREPQGRMKRFFLAQMNVSLWEHREKSAF